MKVDAPLLEGDLARVPEVVQRLEELGFDGAYSYEGPHDPFFPLVVAAGQTERIELLTGIAVAFARNPMVLANIGYDLQAYSRGRFILGLGSQIKAHIEKRFSSEWSKPAARMRELVLAIRAIWSNWQEGTKLDFRGEFYRHTLMTPFFNPGPNPYGLPRIFIAGVGPKMTEICGEVGDGYFLHPFHSQKFVAETTKPALEKGLAAAGRAWKDFEVSAQIMVATGPTEEALAQSAAAIKTQISFYGSTPAYRPVLEAHGWGALQEELNALSKQGKWEAMAECIDDEVLNTIAIVAEPQDVAKKIRERYGDFPDRVSLFSLTVQDPAYWVDVTRDLRD